MKKFFGIFTNTLLLTSLIFMTGCEEDTDVVNDLPPIVSIAVAPAASVIGSNSTVSFTVKVTQGTNDLKTLTIFEGATKVDAARITITGINPANNPQLIPTVDKKGFTWDITLKVHDTFGSKNYVVEVVDDDGLTDSDNFDLLVNEPIEKTITGATIQLWNAGGPVGNGGVDLDDGATTGSADIKAEMRDMGIDSTAGSGDNWRRRIGHTTSTEIKFLGNSLLDFNFNTIESKQQIVNYFTVATAFTATLPTWGSFKVSPEVQEGDVFVVKRTTAPERYYIVKVDKVTETTVLGDNTDNYQVTIKY